MFPEAVPIPRIIKPRLKGNGFGCWASRSADRGRWTLFERLAAACNYRKSRLPGTRCLRLVREFRCQRFLGKGSCARVLSRTPRARATGRFPPVSNPPGNKFAELIRLLCGFHPSAACSRKTARLMASVIFSARGLFRVSCPSPELVRARFETLPGATLEFPSNSPDVPFLYFFRHRNFPAPSLVCLSIILYTLHRENITHSSFRYAL